MCVYGLQGKMMPIRECDYPQSDSVLQKAVTSAHRLLMCTEWQHDESYLFRNVRVSACSQLNQAIFWLVRASYLAQWHLQQTLKNGGSSWFYSLLVHLYKMWFYRNKWNAGVYWYEPVGFMFKLFIAVNFLWFVAHAEI